MIRGFYTLGRDMGTCVIWLFCLRAWYVFWLISSPQHEVLKVSKWGQSISVVCRASSVLCCASSVVPCATSTVCFKSYFSYIPGPIDSKLESASVAQLDAPSNWRPGGQGSNPRGARQHSFVEIDHEIFSTVILSLPLIQEGQLSVSGGRMCTILVNRLED